MLVPDEEVVLPRRFAVTCASFILIGLILSVAGCKDDRIVLVDEGRTYTLRSVEQLLGVIEPSPSVTDAADAAQNRTDALTALRGDGQVGGAAADFITSTFPSGTRGVPFYVERATVDGTPVWLMAEAIGPQGEPLEDERIWVMTDDGSVLFSATR